MADDRISEVTTTSRVERPVPGSVLSEVNPVGSLPPPTVWEDAEFMAPLLKYEDPLMAVGVTEDLKMRHLIPISGETFETEQGEPFTVGKDKGVSWFGRADLVPRKLSTKKYRDVGNVDIIRQAMEKSGVPIPWEPGTVFLSGRDLGDTEKRYKTRAHEIRHLSFNELRKRFWPGLKEKLKGLNPYSSKEDEAKTWAINYPFNTENEKPPFPFPDTYSGTNKDFGEHGLIYIYDWLTNDERLREQAERYFEKVYGLDPINLMKNLAPGSHTRRQIEALNELSNQFLKEQGRPQRTDMDIDKIIQARMKELSPESKLPIGID